MILNKYGETFVYFCGDIEWDVCNGYGKKQARQDPEARTPGLAVRIFGKERMKCKKVQSKG